MAPRRNPPRGTQKESIVANASRRKQRTNQYVDNHDTHAPTEEDQNVDVQGENEQAPPTTPTVYSALINQIVEQRVSELLAK